MVPLCTKLTNYGFVKHLVFHILFANIRYLKFVITIN